ncbi:MAG: DctP family TRAP transporter solute-binding subunit [Synergistaceae bacterium]|nr:DctP family TRAP transporter solute-binding subunit [Synergistaceae bacterium]
MKKFIICTLAAITAATLFIVSAYAAPIKMKVAYVVPEAQSTHIAAEKFFKPYVEKHSNGQIIVELYPNGQLGGDRQAIEAVGLGTIHMTIPAVAVLSGFEPRFQVFDLPFLFNSKQEVYKALDGQLGNKLNALLPPLGLKNLAYAENGFRMITNNRGPITKPSDLAGLKIRTMENPIHMATFRALGANPTPMSFGELYTALQQKTVDAQENPIPLIYTSKFYEVQKYCSLSRHVYAATVLLVNDKWFNSLPKNLQKVLQDAAIIYRTEQRKISDKQDKEMLEGLKKNGMKINDITPEQKKAFIAATANVYDEFTRTVKDGQELIDLAKKK